jgi:hypothetical protein
MTIFRFTGLLLKFESAQRSSKADADIFKILFQVIFSMPCQYEASVLILIRKPQLAQFVRKQFMVDTSIWVHQFSQP